MTQTSKRLLLHVSQDVKRTTMPLISAISLRHKLPLKVTVLLAVSVVLILDLLVNPITSTPTYAASVIFQANFDQDPAGPYTTAEMKKDFNSPPWADGISDGLVSVVTGSSAYSGSSLRVHYPVGRVSYGVIIPVPLKAQYTDLYLSYRVFFPADFDFVKEGKMHGFCGGTCNSGGQKPTGIDGWSSRVIWRSGGTGNQYLYDPDQAGTYGDILPWSKSFSKGAWHLVETRVKMNTPGQHDGIVQSWLDGSLAYQNTTLRFRDVPTLAIDTFKFETFFGGSTSDFAPPKDEYAYFDNFVVSTTK